MSERNEAAERLLEALSDLSALLSDDPSYDWDAAVAKVNEHDAAERRATVERIRERLTAQNVLYPDEVNAILDEEAAR